MPKMVTTDKHPNYPAGAEVYVAQHLVSAYTDRGWVKTAEPPKRKSRKADAESGD